MWHPVCNKSLHMNTNKTREGERIVEIEEWCVSVGLTFNKKILKINTFTKQWVR